MEELARLASTPSDSKTPAENSSAEASSSGKAVVQAFSGKGHTLSSAVSSTGPSAAAEKADPLISTARLVARRRLVDLQEQESILQQKVYSTLYAGQDYDL